MRLLPFALWFLSSFLVHGHEETVPINEGLSLPKLVELTSAKQLANWEVRGSTAVSGGRLLLTPEKSSGRQEGSIWNKNYKLSKTSFTIDFTFRAIGEKGKTGNGLIFWLLNDSKGDVDKLVHTDTSLYGGPSKFDGIAIVVDSDGPLGSTLRGYANDNSKAFSADNSDFFKQEFGKCIIGYQDSQVPATIRITYDDFYNQFKVSIDNKICFESNKFKIPESENNFIVGVSASSGLKKKSEAFEIFKINVYESSLASEREYGKVELASQPVIITKNEKGEVTSKVTGTPSQPEVIKSPPNIETGEKLNEEHINQILHRLSAVDNQLSKKLSETMEKQKIESNDLRKQIERLSSQNDILEKYLKEVDRKLHSLVLTEENKKQEKESAKLELLKNKESEKSSTEKLFKSIKTFIYLLLILICILGTFIYRLRNDIKHAKLL